MKNNNLVLGVLVFCVLQVGCVTQRVALQQACDSTGATLVESVQLKASHATQDVRYVAPSEGSVCIRITRASPIMQRDGHAETLTLIAGPEARLNAFNGGGVTSEISFSQQNWTGEHLYLRRPADGQANALRMRNPGYPIAIDIFELPDPFIPVLPDPGTEEVVLPTIECSGRLRGFRLIDNYGVWDRSAHPLMKRSTVKIICSAKYTNSSVYGNQEIQVTSAETTTDEQGRYSVTIPESTVSVVKSGRGPVFQELIAQCLVPEQCGHEARSLFNNADLVFPVTVPPEEGEADLVDVLHIASQGLVFDPDSGEEEMRFLLGARLITSATTAHEMNDRPFIIHEQIDVFNVEHTKFLLWGFAGQPFRVNYQDEEGKFRSSDPRDEPCDVSPSQQYCVNFSDSCNPNTCDDPGHGCLEYPLIQQLLNAGYDVWLVDHLRGEVDIARNAAAAPLLYQRILDYGGLDGLLPTIPSMDAGKAATFRHDPELLTPVAAAGNLEHHVLIAEPPSIRPFPHSGDRKAIVSGFSLGGLIARIGLRLWEIRDQLPSSSLRDFHFQEIEVVTSPTVFLERPENKIGLYVSLDAPQAGVRIPVALQAYIKRVNRVVENMDDLSAADKKQVSTAVFEINALPTRQLMQQEIAHRVDEKLGCWSNNGDSASACKVQPFDANVEPRVDDEVFAKFIDTWNINASQFEPETQDGLPASIPAISISNGEIGPLRQLENATVMKLRFDTAGASDFSQPICDENRATSDQGLPVPSIGGPTCGAPAEQPAGSEWNNSCQRLHSVEVNKSLFTIEFGGWGEWMVFGLRDIEVSYPMRRKFDSAGNTEEKSGFPTIVPSSSSLLLDNGFPSAQWRDAYWHDRSEYHTNVDEDMCKTILFWADGALLRDKDGWPACTDSSLISACALGGRFPGKMLGANTVSPDRAPCDCGPDDPEVHPGAVEIMFDGIDNNCDGHTDILLNRDGPN